MKRPYTLSVFCILCVAWVAAAATQAGGTIWDGVYTDAQSKRGEAVYAERCASCHAPDLSGMDQAPSLSSADFMTEWTDQSANDLFERIRVSMPADKPGSLERTQVADLLAFMLQKNSIPAGAAELPADAGTLKAIKFVGKKP